MPYSDVRQASPTGDRLAADLLLHADLVSTDMLTLNQPPLTQHISIPKDMSQLSCEAFTAGIVEGVLDGLDLVRCCVAGSSFSPPGNSGFGSTN